VTLVVSQNSLRGNGMLSTTIVQIALTCERKMPTAGRTAGASRGVWSPESTSLALSCL
jgi:hypothetical protein